LKGIWNKNVASILGIKKPDKKDLSGCKKEFLIAY